MQSSKKIKIVISIVLLFSALIGAVIYMASKKLNPEELSALVVTEVEKVIPNSKVSTSGVDLSLGLLATSLNLREFDIKLKGKVSSPLFKVKKLSLKIPIWSIFFGGGKVTLSIDDPVINYEEYPKLSNWELAFKQEKKKATKSQKKSDEKQKSGDEQIVIPGFLASSLIDVEVRRMMVNYSLRDKSSGDLSVEKFLLKDVGVASTTAFELKSHIAVLKNTDNQMELDLLLIGESKLMDWINKGEINLKSSLAVRNIDSKILKRKISSFQFDSNIKLKKDLSVVGNFKALLEERQLLQGSIEKNDKRTLIEDIKFVGNIKSLSELVVDSSKLPILLKGDENIHVDGGVSLGSAISPNFKIYTNKPIIVNQAGLSIKNNIEGVVTSGLTEFKVESELFNGKSFVDVKYNGNVTKISPQSLSPLDVKIAIRDIVVPKKYFAFIENAQKNKKENDDKKIDTDKNETPASPVEMLSPVPANVNLELSNINVNDVIVAGLITSTLAKSGVKVNVKKLNVDKGVITGTSELKIISKTLSTQFGIKLKKLNLSSAAHFVPKNIVDGLSGFLDGSISGSALSDKFNVKVNTTVSNGKLSKINVKDTVEGMLGSFAKYTDKVKKDDLKVDGGFKTLALNGTFTNKLYSFKKFQFVDDKNQLIMSGSGDIRPTGKSELKTELKITQTRLSKNLKREVGRSSFPVVLAGKGFELKPDYSKAIKLVAKSAAKTQAKKQAKKQVKKQLDKLKKGKLKKVLDNKKVDKLLKGIF